MHRYIIYNLYCNIQKHKNQEVQFDFMVTLKPTAFVKTPLERTHGLKMQIFYRVLWLWTEQIYAYALCFIFSVIQVWFVLYNNNYHKHCNEERSFPYAVRPQWLQTVLQHPALHHRIAPADLIAVVNRQGAARWEDVCRFAKVPGKLEETLQGTAFRYCEACQLGLRSGLISSLFSFTVK